MAQKHNPFNVEAAPNSTIVEISSAEYQTHSYENKTVQLSIEGLEVKELDWMQVSRLLIDMGIDGNDVDYLISAFANMTFEHLMAKAIAKKIRRI